MTRICPLYKHCSLLFLKNWQSAVYLLGAIILFISTSARNQVKTLFKLAHNLFFFFLNMCFEAAQAPCHVCTVVQCACVEDGAALWSWEGEVVLPHLEIVLEHRSWRQRELAIKCSYRMIRVAGFQSTETRGRTTLV